MAKFNGILELEVISLVPTSEEKDLGIYAFHFVDGLKNEGKSAASQKSGLFVQMYNDSNHGLLTRASTIQRVSKTLVLSILAMDGPATMFTRDVAQAYI